MARRRTLQATLGDAIMTAGSDAIVAADRADIFWGPGAERIFGYTRGDAVGRSLDIIIPDRLRKRHWDGYSKVMASGESRYGHGDVLAVPGVTKAARTFRSSSRSSHCGPRPAS